MNPAEIEALVRSQAEAYQDATTRFGRRKVERFLVPSLNIGQEDTVGNWGKGGYGTKAVMSHYTTVMTLAGGVPTGKPGSRLTPAQRASTVVRVTPRPVI